MARKKILHYIHDHKLAVMYNCETGKQEVVGRMGPSKIYIRYSFAPVKSEPAKQTDDTVLIEADQLTITKYSNGLYYVLAEENNAVVLYRIRANKKEERYHVEKVDKLHGMFHSAYFIENAYKVRSDLYYIVSYSSTDYIYQYDREHYRAKFITSWPNFGSHRKYRVFMLNNKLYISSSNYLVEITPNGYIIASEMPISFDNTEIGVEHLAVLIKGNASSKIAKIALVDEHKYIKFLDIPFAVFKLYDIFEPYIAIDCYDRICLVNIKSGRIREISPAELLTSVSLKDGLITGAALYRDIMAVSVYDRNTDTTQILTLPISQFI